MLSRIKEPKAGAFKGKMSQISQLSMANHLFYLSGDESELHIIIFDEIDAICKVGISVYLYLDFNLRFYA